MASRKRKTNSDSSKAKKAKDLQSKNDDYMEILATSSSHLDEEICSKAETLIQHNKFAMILGPEGSGRTSLAIHVGKLLKPQRSATFVYVNDQLDSNSLFGSYKTSGVPGDFTFEETLFSKTVQKPNSLIVLKGFESATSDLIVSILRLTEDGFHSLPGARTIQMHESARIVAIVSQTKDFTLPKTIVEYPFAIKTTEYETDQIVRLVTSQMNLPAENVRKFHEVFKSICSLISTLPPTERRLSVRDFFTACKRLCKDSDNLNPTKAFLELYDTWILHLSRLDQQSEAITLAANCFSLGHSDVNFIRNVRVVEINRSDESVSIGRANLPIHIQNEPNQIITTCALTRDYRNLLERLAVCVEANEPVLLNGETGIGKTKIVQQLARYVNAKLSVVNMSLDSDAADLIGGYKPASIHSIIRQYMTNFFDLLDNSPKHELLKTRLVDLCKDNQYNKLLNTIVEICVRAMTEVERIDSRQLWGTLFARGQRIIDFMSSSSGGTPFAYVSGIIARAIQEGNWLLIDEINMASIECLNSIAALLSEHEALGKTNGFRLFACMNPANDAGKRLLPSFIRSKFTELFVIETREKSQLSEIISHYMPSIQSEDKNKLAQFYLELCEKLPKKFSLRNLCRSLLLSKDDMFGEKIFSLHVALELGFSSGSEDNSKEVQSLIQKHIGTKPALKARQDKIKGSVLIEGVNFPLGPHKSSDNENFLRTSSVRANLQKIACATASGRFPVLLEGETSAGKTSILTYLAELTGHKLYRINNHEHTDVQEYLGSYVADENNQLVFRDGVLLQAMQNGDWVILDELNLAPTEVLEALNRLLDDNREVYVPERDQVIKAHPQFRLFATQNPIGRYSGRKRLSRAFLNRFVILNIQQPPNNELTEIVCKRCKVQKSAADIMITVMVKLKELRSNMNLFSSTDSFMTLRDLFRWGNRYANYPDHSDWRQLIADQGYLLLAGRCRKTEDRLKIQQAIEQTTKRKINVDLIFSLQSPYFPLNVREKFNENSMDNFNKHLILTLPMRQMIVQCSQAFEANEPVLFVGDTGCGKTSVTYLLAQNGLESINCHERIDTSDFLGKIRPTNDGLFKWEDGVVVRAMKQGKLLLLDEISLAQDSVLERLNPLLESDRKLLLNDSGASTELIVAQKGFQVASTMNPGGDHGKKELSKALRNRFTEIWCNFEFNEQDVLSIIQRRMQLSSNGAIDLNLIEALSLFITKFLVYFQQKYAQFFKSSFAVRDAIVIADMICNLLIQSKLSVFDATYNTISATLFDALPMLPFRGFKIDCLSIVEDCKNQFLILFNEAKFLSTSVQNDAFDFDCSVNLTQKGVMIGKFFIPNGQIEKHLPKSYCFNAPTALLNVMRIARGLASDKPIMLEGSPGAGKSSLIKAMAELTGHQLIRINLSEQTEVSDLFGADVPVTLADGKTSFVWQDGPVLRAIKTGAWLLLDEMNLASQAILEAMNSCFDFRNEIYIAELGRSFEIDRNGNCRFFACQNSAKDGGGRKSLPKSFLNRFTKIYVSPMSAEDMRAIVQQCLTNANDSNSADFYIQLHKLANTYISTSGGNLIAGAPFEYNLRDLLRLIDSLKQLTLDVAFDLVYIQRLHNEQDKLRLRNKVFMEALNRDCHLPLPMIRTLDKNTIDFGGSIKLNRLDSNVKLENSYFSDSLQLLSCQTGVLQRLVACVNCDFLTLLTGSSYIGKRTIVEMLARLANITLRVMRMTAETDAQDLMGSYEQIFCGKRLKLYADELRQLLVEYATQNNDLILLSKLDALVQLSNPNDMRVMAFDILKSVLDSDISKQAEQLVKSIAKETLHFEWVDSDFVKAYMNGDLLLIEDVNVCSSAVLDRLNNCLEKDGELVITEKADGDFKTVVRHPRFRVFFSMCPNRGAISQAMRNRAVEIFLSDNEMFINSISDKIRLLSNTDASLPLQLNAQSIGMLNDFTLSQLLNTCTLDIETRRKILQLPDQLPVSSNIVDSKFVQSLVEALNQNADFKSIDTSVTNYLQTFYENSWMHLLQLSDPALIFFYSRIATGIQNERSLLIALTDKSITSDQFEACKHIASKPAQSDSTILAVQSIGHEMIEDQNEEFKTYMASHLWLCLRWLFNRSDNSSNSSLSEVKKLLSTNKINEPSVKIAAVCLHVQICAMLKQTHDNFVTFVQQKEKFLFQIALELFTFNALLKAKWDESVGDVAVLKLVRQLELLGLRELFASDDINSCMNAVLKFSEIENRPSDWKQLCLLPENSIPIFDSNIELTSAKNCLVELAQSEKSSLFAESNELLVNVTNQFKSFSLFVNQFKSANFNFGLNILDFSIKALSAFKYNDESLRRKQAEISMLNTRINFGDICLPLLSIYNSSVVNGPLLMFWRQMHYRKSLNDIPIGDLINFSKKLSTLKTYLWQLSNSIPNIRQVLSTPITSIENQIDEFGKLNQGQALGLERMKSYAPIDAVDPILCIFADCELNKSTMTVLFSHYDVLKKYAQTIFAKTDTNAAFVFPELPNHNQFMLFIRERYTQALSLAKEFEQLGENCRPQNTQYQRLATLICDFINNAQRFCDNFNIDYLPNFLETLSKHRCKLLTEFFQYPDVILPYLLGTCELEFQLNKRAHEELTHRQLTHCSTLQINSQNLFDFFSEHDFLNSNQFAENVEFHLTDNSLLPEHVQYYLMLVTLDRLTPKVNHSLTSTTFDWLATRWLSWYEAHSSKRKELYEYRKTSRLNREENAQDEEDIELNEDEMPDMEMIEIRRLLPDFSKLSFDDNDNLPSNTEQRQETVAFTETELMNILSTIVKNGNKLDSKFYTKIPSFAESAYLPAMFYNSSFEGLAPFNKELENVFAVHHLIELNDLMETFASKNEGHILNVYKYSDTSAVLNCIEKISLLKAKILLQKEEFPENTILNDLLRCIDLFLLTPCDKPQMYFASTLEKLLEKAELWERNVPRQYSLNNELTPLREILLEWRKMEVLCWADILNSIGNQLNQNCLLTSWPLVEAFTRKTEGESEVYEKNLLAMLLQWLNDSSLFDLQSRLNACQLLTVLLKFTQCRLNLLSKIESICRYFTQFLPRLDSRVKEERSEAEEKLKNLVQVAKYTDLNIWSVKDSHQRVHNQLCQIIHRFKIGSNKPALLIFTEDFPPIPEFDLSTSTEQSNNTKSHSIIAQLRPNLTELISVNLVDDLTQRACDLRSLLSENVNYSEVESAIKQQGTTDEEEIHEALKKAFGQELFKRQRAFADLRKLASSYGVNFRKGLQLNTEELNELSLTGTGEGINQKLKQLLPTSINARNLAIKLLSELNLHEKPHLKSQLTAEAFSTLRGIAEFGMSFIVNTNNRLCALDRMSGSISSIQTYIQRLIDIQKSDSNAFDHKFLCNELLLVFMDFAQMKHEFDVVCRYWKARPKQIDAESELFDFGQDTLQNSQLIDSLCTKLNTLIKHAERNILKWIERSDGTFWVWQKENVDQLQEFASDDLEQFDESIATLKPYFEHCLSLFLKRYEQFSQRIRKMTDESRLTTTQNAPDFDITSLKLKIQTIYRAIEQNNNEKVKPMERLRQMLQDIKSANLLDVENQLYAYLSDLSVLKLASNTADLLSTVSIFSEMLSTVTGQIAQFLESFSVFYLNFCSIVHHFVNKGLVNPIPIAEKKAEGEGQSTEEGSGDAAGMGSGEGQKDVGDQMEETGQLEDLEGQQNEPETNENIKDSDKPIEMEDDFAADLEGIDAEEENNEREEDEQQEDAAEQADWDMGQIDDQEDEKQLDPKLWEDQKDIQELDQEDQGANEETGELAANEQKESTQFDEKQEEENDEPSGNEDEMENVDDVQLENDESDHEMEIDPTNEQTNEESESVDDVNEQIQDQDPTELEEPEKEVEELPNQDEAEKSEDTTQRNDAFGQTAADDKNNCVNDSQVVAENETMEGGEQGEQLAIGEKQGETTAQKTEEMTPDDQTESSTSTNALKRNQHDDALEMIDESNLVDEHEEDELNDERGNQYTHIADKKESNLDKQLVQSSTVEQAASSKDKIHYDRESKEKEEKAGKFTELNERKPSEYKLSEPVINVRPGFDFARNKEEAVVALKSSLENVSEFDADARWSIIEESVEIAAAELAEQLRIIIEPTSANKLQGDYKTGKRLNMRRLPPYIASNFRKDRIWLRRTKMDKRDLNVGLSIDCSSSMKDNLATELTAQSVALLNKAFDLLQIGRVSVVKFGDDVNILRNFGEDIDEFGPKLLQVLKFDEQKTDIVKLLNCMVTHFEEARANSTNVSDQLLIILGDGRFSGASTSQVRNSLGHLFDANITVLYVILDSQSSSIFNVKVFKNKQLVSYMQDFPFPFYTVVQNISMVPLAVAEALKQFVDLRNC